MAHVSLIFLSKFILWFHSSCQWLHFKVKFIIVLCVFSISLLHHWNPIWTSFKSHNTQQWFWQWQWPIFKDVWGTTMSQQNPTSQTNIHPLFTLAIGRFSVRPSSSVGNKIPFLIILKPHSFSNTDLELLITSQATKNRLRVDTKWSFNFHMLFDGMQWHLYLGGYFIIDALQSWEGCKVWNPSIYLKHSLW